jgi:hypothetical protein
VIENGSDEDKRDLSAIFGKQLYIPVGYPVYNQVVIEKNMVETWFCSENQALKAGFSKSPSCK